MKIWTGTKKLANISGCRFLENEGMNPHHKQHNRRASFPHSLPSSGCDSDEFPRIDDICRLWVMSLFFLHINRGRGHKSTWVGVFTCFFFKAFPSLKKVGWVYPQNFRSWLSPVLKRKLIPEIRMHLLPGLTLLSHWTLEVQGWNQSWPFKGLAWNPRSPKIFYMCCGLNSYCFPCGWDGHHPYRRGLCTIYIRIPY